jgi:ribosomal protein S18 acetylase RimI-like enzyme
MEKGEIQIHSATAAERDTSAKILAAALQTGSYVGYLTSRSKNQLAALEAYFRICFDACQIRSVLGNNGGVALWELPGSKTSLLQNLEMIPIILKFDLRRLPLCLRTMYAKAKAKPKTEHYYLSVVGILPEHQGKGFGTMLLRPTLAECDKKNTGAYLETGNPRNIPFYERLGFKIRERIVAPGSSMPFATMWREPISPRGLQ